MSQSGVYGKAKVSSLRLRSWWQQIGNLVRIDDLSHVKVWSWCLGVGEEPLCCLFSICAPRHSITSWPNRAAGVPSIVRRSNETAGPTYREGLKRRMYAPGCMRAGETPLTHKCRQPAPAEGHVHMLRKYKRDSQEAKAGLACKLARAQAPGLSLTDSGV